MFKDKRRSRREFEKEGREVRAETKKLTEEVRAKWDNETNAAIADIFSHYTEELEKLGDVQEENRENWCEKTELITKTAGFQKTVVAEGLDRMIGASVNI